MKIETELDAGDSGYFLLDDRVQTLDVFEVRAVQTTFDLKSPVLETWVEYLVSAPGEKKLWVSSKRAARTKAELLAKL